ncbi:nucleoside recognition domain-containing protein [Paludibacter jiangxiensis]|uniref:Spore maturation protein SpmA n=1 Tax=Paludibacter jiangxiensis TaxID=681398 RepID=A0A161LCE5_9BACT|nr:nucleoside recognition domain-containing protein [Paludibacter jiangxiensis]GAT61445.1 spore maturation protein SpmA [Paludibacter jiangxiensis]
MLNYIWIGFFLIAFLVATLQFIFTGDFVIFEKVVKSTFEMAKFSVMDIALPLAGVMTLWLGLMNIGEKAGAIRFVSRIVGPFFSKLYPEIPKGHPASGQLVMNYSANMLGLDNAATPIGLKAMQSLQELNPNKDTASNAQIMFLALNTAGLTLLPINIIAQRAILGAVNPADILVPVLIATYVSTLTAILYVGIRQRLNLLNRTVIGWLGAITFIIGLIVFGFSRLDSQQMSVASSITGNSLLLLIIATFLIGGLVRKVNVYEAFIEGAKQGFETAVKTIPYLVGMLVAIGAFRASGAMDMIINGIASLFHLMGLNTDFVAALPNAFMKPLSGSGAKALMVETMKTYGPDSFAGHLSCIFQGAADTTFYIVALYFGSVGVTKTRYAISAGLIADLAGAIAAIIVAYLFFA